MNKLGVYNKRHSISSCSSARRVDSLLQQSWEISPHQATGWALGADSPTEINKSPRCFCERKTVEKTWGWGVSTVKPKPSGVGVRSLQVTWLEATGQRSALQWGGFIMRPAQKKHSFSSLPKDQGAHPAHTSQRKGRSLYPIV